MFRPLCSVLLALASAVHGSDLQSSPVTRVVFVGPGPGESVFWDQVMEPMPARAAQLGIDLRFEQVPFDNRFEYLQPVKSVLSGSTPPDYIITMPRGASALPLLEAFEGSATRLVTINSAIPSEEAEAAGAPGTVYQQWVGQLFFDDTSVGYTLADTLISMAKKRFEARPLRMIVLSGDRVLDTSRARDSGALQRLSSAQEVDMLQRVVADWNRAKARTLTTGLRQRYGQLHIVWAANDDIALGALDTYGNDETLPVIGGVDATSQAIAAIQAGKMSVTYGGNHRVGVLALEYIVAYETSPVPVAERTKIYPFQPILADYHRN
ncbi:substrate-binding domain-containing protein [Aestuariibacter halophilus]|uniref:Substrate-binding domain-containing protein n=1 Tax=Fluctibacter halophilus TaxID=226011 RepID=A0ABS8G9M4_9ALTE|nr:substrate-binding domain-containing protein [Aestuariibacter halophilus]MCC2617260.1 substrate-binding domain-containing protein [Aestuariibacter halophilus]